VRQHLDAQRAAREGLCPCCGGFAGEVRNCPICGALLRRECPYCGELVGMVRKCPTCGAIIWKVGNKKGGKKKR
jgi:hypothetical protein